MHKNLKRIKGILNSIDIENDTQRQLNRAISRTNKTIQKLDFQQKRSGQDKEVAINFLNKTIEDLEEQQDLLAQSNKKLLQQKQLVENQSKTLRENLNKLEVSYQELEQFSYIASHDLKSPLRNIAGFAQLLKRQYQGEIDDTADEYIDFIVKSTVHMGDVIRDLLEYSKMGKNDALFEFTDLNELIEQVTFHLRDEISSNEALIVYENLPRLKVYPIGMIQVFQNLISNAIKFRTELQPVIKIHAQKEKNHWKFILSDNGVGLNEAYQEKVFLPFQRINRNEIKGTGIGLAICKKVVLMHKGSISYSSVPEEGTTFYFTIYQGD